MHDSFMEDKVLFQCVCEQIFFFLPKKEARPESLTVAKSCARTYKITDYSLWYSLLFLAGHPKQRSPVPRNGFSTKPDLQTREAGRQFIQQMKEKCEEQARRLSRIQEELKRTSCGFDVFVITTQHFFMKVRLLLLSMCRMCLVILKLCGIISPHCLAASEKPQPFGDRRGKRTVTLLWV